MELPGIVPPYVFDRPTRKAPLRKLHFVFFPFGDLIKKKVFQKLCQLKNETAVIRPINIFYAFTSVFALISLLN